MSTTSPVPSDAQRAASIARNQPAERYAYTVIVKSRLFGDYQDDKTFENLDSAKAWADQRNNAGNYARVRGNATGKMVY